MTLLWLGHTLLQGDCFCRVHCCLEQLSGLEASQDLGLRSFGNLTGTCGRYELEVSPYDSIQDFSMCLVRNIANSASCKILSEHSEYLLKWRY